MKDIASVIAGQSPNERSYNQEGNGAILINGPAEYSKEDFGCTRTIKWTTEPTKIIEKDVLLFCLRGSTTGRLNVSHAKVCIGRGVAGIKAFDHQGFLNYFFMALRPHIIGNSKGTTFASITSEDLRNTLILKPPLHEQTAIANYLDEKTAQIDKKIQLFEQKIRTYRELKQSLINESVCRGLDKDVALKDSKIPWIGEIPVHWEVKRLKDLVNINQLTLGEDVEPDYKFKYIDIGNVGNNGVINEPSWISFKSAPSRARRIVKKNDVIISTVRTYLKAIAFFKDEPKDVIVSTGFAVLSPSKIIVPNYLNYAVRAEYFVGSVSKNSVGVSYPAINASTLSNLTVILPEFREQVAIAEYLDEKTYTIDTIVANLTKQIATLQELKKTLINDVVTGKLKVA